MYVLTRKIVKLIPNKIKCFVIKKQIANLREKRVVTYVSVCKLMPYFIQAVDKGMSLDAFLRKLIMPTANVASSTAVIKPRPILPAKLSRDKTTMKPIPKTAVPTTPTATRIMPTTRFFEGIKWENPRPALRIKMGTIIISNPETKSVNSIAFTCYW